MNETEPRPSAVPGPPELSVNPIGDAERIVAEGQALLAEYHAATDLRAQNVVWMKVRTWLAGFHAGAAGPRPEALSEEDAAFVRQIAWGWEQNPRRQRGRSTEERLLAIIDRLFPRPDGGRLGELSREEARDLRWAVAQAFRVGSSSRDRCTAAIHRLAPRDPS